MSLIAKTNPIGIDDKIDFIQKLLFNGLTSTIPGWTNYQSYHRAYINETADGQTFEIEKDKDTPDSLFDDNFNATSFFVLGDTQPFSEGRYTATLAVIFQVKLDKLYPTITDHRPDEEARRDVLKILETEQKNIELTSIEMGIRNVYSEIGFGSQVYDDMSKFHVFRVNLEVNYVPCK